MIQWRYSIAQSCTSEWTCLIALSRTGIAICESIRTVVGRQRPEIDCQELSELTTSANNSLPERFLETGPNALLSFASTEAYRLGLQNLEGVAISSPDPPNWVRHPSSHQD